MKHIILFLTIISIFFSCDPNIASNDNKSQSTSTPQPAIPKASEIQFTTLPSFNWQENLTLQIKYPASDPTGTQLNYTIYTFSGTQRNANAPSISHLGWRKHTGVTLTYPSSNIPQKLWYYAEIFNDYDKSLDEKLFIQECPSPIWMKNIVCSAPQYILLDKAPTITFIGVYMFHSDTNTKYTIFDGVYDDAKKTDTLSWGVGENSVSKKNQYHIQATMNVSYYIGLKTTLQPRV